MTEEEMNGPIKDAPQFPLGRIEITDRASNALPANEVYTAVYRHGDRNDEALRTGDRILSTFTSSNGVKFWIITAADRSRTTILLPDEY